MTLMLRCNTYPHPHHGGAGPAQAAGQEVCSLHPGPAPQLRQPQHPPRPPAPVRRGGGYLLHLHLFNLFPLHCHIFPTCPLTSPRTCTRHPWPPWPWPPTLALAPWWTHHLHPLWPNQHHPGLHHAGLRRTVQRLCPVSLQHPRHLQPPLVTEIVS